MFSFDGHGKALGVRGGSEPVEARSAHFGLPLGLGGASGAQCGVAYWAGAAVRHRVGEATWG